MLRKCTARLSVRLAYHKRYPITFFLTKYIPLKYNYKIYNKKLIIIIKVFKNKIRIIRF